RPRIVVSISTFGGRTQALENCVKSLVRQTLQPDAILIHIPNDVVRVKQKELDKTVLELPQRYPLVKIHHPKDYGPSTKLLGALLLEKDPDTIVVTLDDDTEYHAHMLYHLVQFMTEKSGLAPCFVCQHWPWYQPWPSWAWYGTCKGWANAYAGVAYRVGWFTESVFDFDRAPDGCKLHDDVWISGNLHEKDIRPYVIKPGYFSVVSHFRHPSLSINSVKNGEKGHRDPCIAFFNRF
ncbi:hypothetical protein EDD86DRAFT_257625, partial [Gorgonomyces haynaldii]